MNSYFITLVIASLTICASGRYQRTTTTIGRVDCYPDREAKHSNFSEDACLARGCFFDDNNEDDSNDVPCYFKFHYGYKLQGDVQDIPNGKRLRLTRNQAVTSPFAEPIDNVLLDVHYYTNDIIRFKLYDADQQRFEV